jgi:hypothetical protein
VEIIAAHGGKKYKSIKSDRDAGVQNQVPCLPAHNYGTQGNINTAENEKVKKFPEHLSGPLEI